MLHTGVSSLRSLVARLVPSRRPARSSVGRPAGSEQVDPWSESGYVFGEHGFEEVASYDADALVIASGGLVRMSAGEADATWCVMGRGSDGERIAVARAGAFGNVAFEDLLRYNAQYLVGQRVVAPSGAEWVVERAEGSELVLRQGSETLRAAASEIVHENRAALRARAVILVDKG